MSQHAQYAAYRLHHSIAPHRANLEGPLATNALESISKKSSAASQAPVPPWKKTSPPPPPWKKARATSENAASKQQPAADAQSASSSSMQLPVQVTSAASSSSHAYTEPLAIELWTLGLADALQYTRDPQLVERSVNCSKAQSLAVPADLPQRLLMAGNPQTVLRTDIFVAIDCRDFSDREAAGSGHLGSHYTNLLGFVKNGAKVYDQRLHKKVPMEFKLWFKQRALALLWDALQKNLDKIKGEIIVPKVHIICYCRSGKHRSVGMATLLQHALGQWPMVAPTFRYTSNMSRSSWGGRNMCKECEDCMRVDDERASSAREVAAEVPHHTSYCYWSWSTVSHTWCHCNHIMI